MAELEARVPFVYRHPDRAGLFFTVVTGENKFDIQMTANR
jgi:hypothetical protein